MSSSEEYLDSLLDSILGGDQSDHEPSTESSQTASGEPRFNAEAGKAMSTAEIEEMLVSMGTLGSGEDGAVSENMADVLADDLSLDDMLTEEQPLENLSLDDLSLDELSAEEGTSEETVDAGADELSLDGMSSDNLSLDDMLSDEQPLDDLALDDLSLDELSAEEGISEEAVDAGADELSLDDMLSDELSLDGMSSDEQLSEDLSLDDLSLDELSAEEGVSEETVDAGVDELSLDDMLSDEQPLEDMSLDDLSLDELSAEESALEETVDSGTDELTLDETSLDDLSLDDLHLDELSLEETGEEGAGGDESEGDMEIEEPDLSEDIDLGDLALEEHMMDEMEGPADDADGLMSEEDIDRLLSGEDGGESAGDFALEESEEGAEGDDDLSALLAGMDHDEDLSEINNLLEESDQGVSADDDMLAMLEGTDDESGDSFDFFENDEAAKEAESIRELSPEEIAVREGKGEKPKKEKKKRKKLFGRKKKDGDEEESAEGVGTELEDLLGTDGEEAEQSAEEKKPGLVARILNFLLESDEEEEDPLAAEILADNAGETGTVTDENKELLAELNEEDKKGKKKKKKDKKKGKKGKEGEGEEGAENAEGAEGEEDKKAKKKKKKEKKAKEAAEIDLLAPPEKKLSKKKVITVFVFCGTIAACIVLVSTFLPNYMQKRQAHVAYDHRNYDEVFTLLYDKKRGEQDEILFQRSNIVLQMERKLDSYDNYVRLNMRLEALNALISGVSRYQKLLPDAETYNVVGEVTDSYAQILERLSADFGVSEEQALVIIASEDDVTYSQLLEAIINGALSDGEESGARQDVLPEEEEIIERIEGLE